jgi:hypothetical protein
MSHAPGLKAALKRGALITAANWPLVAVQFVAESTLKLLLAVPVLGGIFLVAPTSVSSSAVVPARSCRRSSTRWPRARRRSSPSSPHSFS